MAKESGYRSADRLHSLSRVSLKCIRAHSEQGQQYGQSRQGPGLALRGHLS